MKTATITDRTTAFIIDLLLIAIIIGFMMALLDSRPGSVATLIPAALYHFIFLSFFNGQTPGKMMMNLRVVRIADDHTPPSPLAAGLRVIGYGVNTPLLGLGWLWAIMDDDRQGWHDKLAGTRVVSTADR